MLKKTFLIFLSFLLLLLACVKEYNGAKISILETGVSYRINEIYFIDQQNGFAIGGDRYNEGYILKTIDGGKTWTKLTNSQIALNGLESLQTLNDIHFANDSIGEIVGYGGKILHTENGGNTWTGIQNGTWENFTAVHVFNQNKTLLASAGAYASGSLFSSTSAWYYFDMIAFEYSLRNIYFIDENIGFLLGYGAVQKTTDGGITWQLLSPKLDYFFDIDFPSEQIGYMCGWEGGIYKTIDQGKTWKTINATNKAFSIRQHYENISFINESLGAVCGYSGEVLLTQNGGETWQKIDTKTKENFHAIHFLQNDKILVGGDNGLLIEIVLP